MSINLICQLITIKGAHVTGDPHFISYINSLTLTTPSLQESQNNQTIHPKTSCIQKELCRGVLTRTPRTNLHIHARIRTVSWFQPFLNLALKSMNGLARHRCNNILSTPRHLSRRIRPMSESPLSNQLTAPICDMWYVRVVTRTYYPNERSLATPRVMSLEIQHSL